MRRAVCHGHQHLFVSATLANALRSAVHARWDGTGRMAIDRRSTGGTCVIFITPAAISVALLFRICVSTRDSGAPTPGAVGDV
ncbi:hypothetical protein PPGU16_81810 (plasmid) [Paraburkholderia largidicola]|uniref:Uncharacterized protein n=1 Tax=Paraburkholderia largidicola TaxID=3014751 RepID=A0A7I8C261_9BURK|nr:hypothetical protein PPGU16_81810 [Paraburkholderia sp. PGU16]